MKEKFMLVDFNNDYAISNMGVVKNVKTGRVLKHRECSKGYVITQLSNNKVTKGFRVHRLVALSFIPNEKNLPYINHIDGVKNNNKINNLEWCTAKQNDEHARAMGLKGGNKPILSTNLETGETTTFESISECARYFGCNKSYIHRVLKKTYGRTKYKQHTFEYIQE